MLSNTHSKSRHDLPYWSFPTKTKTEINMKSPHLSTHYHNVTLSHTYRHYTWRFSLPLTNAQCLPGILYHTQQDTFFDYGYIFLPAQQRLLSITTEHKNHQEKETIYSIEFHWACFVITKQLGSEALVFYEHLTEMTAQRSTIVAGCLNNTGCMDLIRLTVANNSRHSQFAQY